jgi:hypothetical protein
MTVVEGKAPFWTWARVSAACFAVAAVWALASYVDLGDGSTWTKRARREGGPFLRQVDNRTDPSRFTIIAVFRGVLPVVLIGTLGGVLGLAAIGQRMNARP